MEYFKFISKQDALNFIQVVNEGEGISVGENTTQTYTQPIDFLGEIYVICDEVTSKYSTEPTYTFDVDLDSKPVMQDVKLVRVIDDYDGTITIHIFTDRHEKFKAEYTESWTDADVDNHIEAYLGNRNLYTQITE